MILRLFILFLSLMAGRAVLALEKTCFSDPVFSTRACFFEANKKAARTLVFVHGVNGKAEDWERQFPVFSHQFHIVAVDLPGFGESGKSETIYSPTNYADFLHGVVKRFVKSPFVLIGHSMGGAVSLRYAAKHPENIEQLVLVDVAGILHGIALSKYAAAKWSGGLTGKSQDSNWVGRLTGKLLEDMERLPLDVPQLLLDGRDDEGVFSLGSGQVAALALVDENFSAALPAVAAPTLIVWGAEDPVAPVRTGRVLAAMIPDARLQLIPDARHVPMREKADSFNQTLSAFLSEPAAEKRAQRPQAGARVGPDSPDGECDRESGRIFEGEFRRLTIRHCVDVEVRNARIGQLEVIGSRVNIVDSDINSDEAGVYAHSSDIVITSSRVAGAPAILAAGSRFDIAGSRLRGRDAAVRATRNSNFVFSVSTVESPVANRPLHDFVVVTPKKPL